MTVKIKVPTQLRQLVGGQSEVSIEGASTVGELIQKMGADHPEMLERILDENGELRRFVNIYVGDEDVRFLQGLDTSLEGQTSVSILPAVAGGCALN